MIKNKRFYLTFISSFCNVGLYYVTCFCAMPSPQKDSASHSRKYTQTIPPFVLVFEILETDPIYIVFAGLEFTM